MLNDEENKLRSSLLNRMIQSSGVVDASELNLQAKDVGINVSSALKGLKNKGLAVTQDNGSVTGVYPFSALPTNHKVQVGEVKSVYGMCATEPHMVLLKSYCQHLKNCLSQSTMILASITK